MRKTGDWGEEGDTDVAEQSQFNEELGSLGMT